MPNQPHSPIEFVQCEMEGEPRGLLAHIDDMDVIVLDTRLTGAALCQTVQDLTCRVSPPPQR